MNKLDAIKKLVELEEKAAELKAIIDKPEVKPLFPRSWEVGARFAVDRMGSVFPVDYSHDLCGLAIHELAKQGRTFYTKEAAEAFTKRERARAYCLERINEANEGDNGFKPFEINYCLYWNAEKEFMGDFVPVVTHYMESNEYIRTKEAVDELVHDPQFVKQWKIWKGIE